MGVSLDLDALRQELNGVPKEPRRRAQPAEVTAVPPEREPEFQSWVQRYKITDLDHPDSHYDYRGAFLAGVDPDAASGHWPDTYKQHGHPTFSVESEYAAPDSSDAGHWQGETFVPPKPKQKAAAAPAPLDLDAVRSDLERETPVGPPTSGVGPDVSARYGGQFGEPMNEAARDVDAARGTNQIGTTAIRTPRTAALGIALGAGKAVLSVPSLIRQGLEAAGRGFVGPEYRRMEQQRELAGGPPEPEPGLEFAKSLVMGPLELAAGAASGDPESIGSLLAFPVMGRMGADAVRGRELMRGTLTKPEAAEAFAHLGLDPHTATAADVNAAFREAAMRSHPDVAPEVRTQRGGPADPLVAAQEFAAASAARDAALESLGHGRPEQAPTSPQPAAEETAYRAREARKPKPAPAPPGGPATETPVAAAPPEPAAGPAPIVTPPPPGAVRSEMDMVADEAARLSVTQNLTPEQQARHRELMARLRAEGERMAREEPPPPLEQSAAATTDERARATSRRIIEKERRQEQRPYEGPERRAAVEGEAFAAPEARQTETPTVSRETATAPRAEAPPAQGGVTPPSAEELTPEGEIEAPASTPRVTIKKAWIVPTREGGYEAIPQEEEASESTTQTTPAAPAGGALPPPARGEPAGEPAGSLPAARALEPTPGAPPVGGGGGGTRPPEPHAAPAEARPVQPAEARHEDAVRGGLERAGEGARPARPRVGTVEAGSSLHGERGTGRGSNYRITDDDHIGEGGHATKVRDNLAAIKLLKLLELEGRQATTAEQGQLVKYVGWGGVPQAFNLNHREWGEEARQLRELLTDDEYEKARASTPNAHYTSPTVIRAIYRALDRLGLDGGRLLEPSAGVGHFIGLEPEGWRTRWTAVELDHVSGRMMKQLYPSSDVKIAGFEEAPVADGFYHAAVSNVPFGNYPVHDPAYNKYAWPIHNYFIVKMLDKVRPGGIVAAVTSHYSMDSPQHQAWRQVVGERADLVGAIRLPRTAFLANAGTEVTTDILFFQKRAPGVKAAGEPWMGTSRLSLPAVRQTGEISVPVNEYFLANPQMVLGRHALTGTQYQGDEYAVEASEGDLGEQLVAAIANLPENVINDQPAVTDQSTGRPVGKAAGGYTLEGGKLLQNGAPVTGAKVAQISAMARVRDAAREALRTQADDEPDKVQASARAALNKAYDSLVRRYGPINKTVKSGTGTRRPNLEVFEADPDVSLLAALEDVDEERDAIVKAPIFTERVIEKQPPIKADSPNDALLAVLNERGRVDLDRMAELLHQDKAAVREALRGLVYENPESGQLETADNYLSGNVRAKLKAAKLAAAADPQYAENAKALEAVQPEDVPPSQIAASLGAPWVPTTDVVDFVHETLGESSYRQRVRVAYLPVEATWAIEAPHDIVNSVKARKEFGTERVGAVKLIEDALNQIATTVYDPHPTDSKKRVINEKETLAAREQQQKLKDLFGEWLWKEPKRGTRLHRHYNDTYNNFRPARYDGSHLTLPGSSNVIKLLPHQKDAIFRGLQQRKLGLFQVVGAGKTYEMAAIAMEAKRLGLTHKAMHVVPNHLVGQFQRDFLKLYPAARILVADDKSFARAGAAARKEFVARIATGNWDSVIITHSSFARIPMSKEFEIEFMREQLGMYEDAVREAKEGRNRDLTKMIEKGKKRLQARLKQIENREAKDELLPFEQLGVDHLSADEAQAYKNLYFMTKMRNVPGAGQLTQRSMDMFLKSRYLDQSGGRLVLATGTPISNTISEMFTMQRYLQPELLRERGIEHFDAWAATFGEARTALELAPSGGGYRMNTRFAYFKNVGELAQLFRAMADVKTAEDLKLPIPKLRGGKPAPVVVPGTPELKAYIDALVERAAAIKKRQVDPTQDNMLKVTHDGRLAALDIRLRVPGTEPPDTKIRAVADKVHELWQATKAERSTQLVFINTVKPRSEKIAVDIYSEVKRALETHGIPAEEIAFVHDADTDLKKETLFRRVREGRVRVMMGSIGKMGMGTNVQDRLLALHHVDAPWRPADIEQGDGRILRRGNRNPEVQIYHYVTEGSFDSYIWQMLERKARAIDQMMKADAATRTIEDVDGRALTFAEIKAISTGNPLVMEKASVDAEVQRLNRLVSAHRDRQFQIAQDLAGLPQRIEAAQDQVKAIQADNAKLVDVSGKKFTVTIGDEVFTERAKAGTRLVELSHKLSAGETQIVRLGKYAGLDLVLDVTRAGSALAVNIGLMGERTYLSSMSDSPQGAIQTLEHLPGHMGRDLANARDRVSSMERQQGDLERLKDEPFPQAEALAKLERRQVELNKQLDLDKHDANEVAAEGDVPEEGSDAASETPEVVDLEDALADAAGTPAGQEPEAMPPALNRQLREQLVGALGLSHAESESLEDTDIARKAVKAGILDDVTERDLIEQARRWLVETGAGLSQREMDDADVEAALRKADADNMPHVFSEKQPEGLGFISNYFLPPSWAMERLTHSKNQQTAAAAALGQRIVAMGQNAHLALARYADQRESLVRQTEKLLDKRQREQLDALLRAVVRTDELPKGTDAKVTSAFGSWRRQFLEDKRLMGQMRRLVLRGRSKAILDAAMEEWPEGMPAPDFDTTPVNRRRLLEAADDAGIVANPTTRAAWDELHAKLKEEKIRVAKPAFMDSPDLRTTFQYLRGEGGIDAYAPEVHLGDWKVRAGPLTARFADRLDAIAYARKLLEAGRYDQDIYVVRDAYMPDYGVHLSRKAWLAMRSKLAQVAGDEAATVSMKAGKVKIRPRSRFFAHSQQRLVHLETYEKDFSKYIRTYNWRLSRYLAFTPFRHGATDLLESLPFDGGWRDWAEAYIAGTQGVPGELTTSINNTLTHLFRGYGGPIPLQTGAGMWQRFVSFWLGGYNPVWPVLHTIQYMTNVPAAFAENGHQWAARGLAELVRGSPESKAAIDAAGIRFQHPSYAVSEYLPRGVGGKGESWWHPMWMFNKALDVMRSATVLAKYYEQRAAGRAVADAQTAATQFVRDTYFDFSMADAPRVMRGPLGRVAGQLQLYGINQMLFAEDLFRRGNWRQRAAFTFHMWAWMGSAALLATWPLFVLNWILGKTGWFRDKNGRKDSPWGALWDQAGPVNVSQLLSFAKYGILGLFGVNLSEHVGMMGPSGWRMPVPISLVQKGVQAMTEDDPRLSAAARRQMLPVAVQRIMKAWLAAHEHQIRDSYGRVAQDAVRTPDLIRLATGFQSVQQAERSDEIAREREIIADYKDARTGWLEQVAQAYRSGGWDSAAPVLARARVDGVLLTGEDVRTYIRHSEETEEERRRRRTPAALRPSLGFPVQPRRKHYTP